MDGASRGNRARSSYLGNMNARFGSKLPPGVTQPPQFAKRPWERPEPAPSLQGPRKQPAACSPLSHTPHIRNPQLRQYYLQGTSWDPGRAAATNLASGGSTGSQGLPGDAVFRVTSASAHQSPSQRSQTQCLPLVHSELLLHTEENTPAVPDLDSCPKQTEADQLPSPEAEYDKLLDVEAVPMPDGQLYLLALPPECCRGEGPEATPYLKLFCRYITDRKGVISGILLVTSNKIFFDPCKTHPLVREHGCEEYLLSCSVDDLQSVCFFSDISHVHFSASQRRRQENNIFQRFKAPRSCRGSLPDLPDDPHPDSLDLCGLAERLRQGEAESGDMQEAQWELDDGPLNFCCGGQEAANEVKTDLLQAGEAEESSVKDQTSAPPAGRAGALMFVRLRVHSCTGKRTGGGLHFGPNKPSSSRRDAWLTLSQESADELQAFLKRCRPDLQTRRGDREAGALPDDEEFVLVEDSDREQMSQRHCSSGEDWEMVSMEDSRERPPPLTDRDPEGLHQVVESSHILEASHVRELCKELPARNVSQAWQLTYSTSRHGASLKSLYRKLQATDSPGLVVIKDAGDEIFGAFLSHPLRPSEEFYGTGETFLFMLHPRFKCFKWTGENSFFIKGYMDSFAIGGGSGHFGLWVDENLYLGHSSPCYTFNNCCLSETNDFRVMELEVWTFS